MKILTPHQRMNVDNILRSFSQGNKITISKLSVLSNIDPKTAQMILQMLSNKNILETKFAVYCPQCEVALLYTDNLTEIDESIFCHSCEERVQISNEDIEVIYIFKDCPFVKRQQNHFQLTSSVANVNFQKFSLADFINNDKLDVYGFLYRPTDADYKYLESLYNSVFECSTTKEKGDSLERLTKNIFNLCKAFKANEILTQTNQLDCYVRNISKFINIGYDDFIIECKNENKTVSGSYIAKLHSIVKRHNKSIGIIVSKSNVPSTFSKLCREILLTDKIIIISFNKTDLFNLVYNRKNLLELIERKIEELKLNSKKTLNEYGLYNA